MMTPTTTTTTTHDDDDDDPSSIVVDRRVAIAVLGFFSHAFSNKIVIEILVFDVVVKKVKNVLKRRESIRTIQNDVEISKQDLICRRLSFVRHHDLFQARSIRSPSSIVGVRRRSSSSVEAAVKKILGLFFSCSTSCKARCSLVRRLVSLSYT